MRIRGENTHAKMDPVKALAVRAQEPDYIDIPDTSKSKGGEIDSWGEYTWAHSRTRTPTILGEYVKTYLNPSTYHNEWSKRERQVAFRALSLCAIRIMYANPTGYWQGHCGRYDNFQQYLKRRSVEDSDIDDYTPDLWNLLKGLRKLNLQNLKDSLAHLAPPSEGETDLGVEVFLGRQICVPNSSPIFDRLAWKVFYKISDISITDALGVCRTFEQMHQLYMFEAFGFLSFWKKKGLLEGRSGRFWDLVMRGFLCLTTGPCSERIMALLSAAAGVALDMFQKRYWMLGFMSKETTPKQLNDLVKGLVGNIDIIVVDPLSKTAKNVSCGTLWLPTSKSLPAREDMWGTRCISDHLEFKSLMQEVKKVFESYHLDPESMDFSEFKVVILINRLHNKPIMFGTLAGAYTLGEVFEVGMHAMQKYMSAADFDDFTSILDYSFYGSALRKAGEDFWSRGESFQERWFISNLLLSLIENGHLVKLSEDTSKPSADIRIFVTSDGRDLPMPHFWINYPKHTSVEPSPLAKFANKRRKLAGIGRRKGNLMTVLALDLPDFWYPTDISSSLALATRFTDSDGTVYEWRKPPYDYPGSADAWCAALTNLFDLKDGIHAVYDRVYIISRADDERHEARVAMVHDALLDAGVYPSSFPPSWTTYGVFKDYDSGDEGGSGGRLWRGRDWVGFRKTKKGKWEKKKKHERYAERYLDVVKEVLGATPEALSMEIVKDVLSAATPVAPPAKIASRSTSGEHKVLD